MNILIFTFGSRGDVQPYVALGAALRTQGHAVTVTTGQGFDEMITSHGLASGEEDKLIPMLAKLFVMAKEARSELVAASDG